MDYRGGGDIARGAEVTNQRAVRRQEKHCGCSVAKTNKLQQEDTANCKCTPPKSYSARARHSRHILLFTGIKPEAHLPSHLGLYGVQTRT